MEIKEPVLLQVKKRTVEFSMYTWVVLFVTMLAGVAAPLNQFKVPPVIPVLMEQFHLDLTAVGLLMSIFAITGLVLALPAGIILHKLGAKLTGLMAIASLLLGVVLGAVSTDMTLLLSSRLIEGIGMGLIAVVGPAVITLWFPPKKRGLPMGIWATWVPLGSLVIYNLAPLVNSLAGWQAVWWVVALITLAIFVLYLLLFRVPENNGTVGSNQFDGAVASISYLDAIRSREIWLLALSFCCFNFVVIGVIATFFPAFLKSVRNFSLAEASYVTSIKMLVCVVIAPLIGWISDKVGSPRKIILISFAGLMLFMIFPFNLSGWMISLLMVFLGFIAAAISTATFSSAPEVTRPGYPVGITIGVVMIGQNLGQLAGPLVFSRLVENIGWATAGYWMIVVLIIGFAATWLIKMK
jgi:MFS family permease